MPHKISIFDLMILPLGRGRRTKCRARSKKGRKERRVSHESCKRIPGIVSKDRCSAGRMGKNASKIG